MRHGLPRRLVICLAEDRKSCEPALRLIMLSLCRYSSNVAMTVFYPEADQEFLDWTHGLNSEKIVVRTTPVSGAYSWNVKPQALLQLLKEGNQEVVWIDSDILVTKDIFPAFSDLNDNMLLVTEEALWVHNETDALRARLWGFPVRRSFPFPLNTAVMRVTQAHILLLERWKEILESQKYKTAQQQPWHKRPLHMLSDQDVLTALLSSEEFHTVPIRLLRRGSDIIQYFGPLGFTLAERMTCMVRGMPIFIHSQSWKPWLTTTDAIPEGFRGKIEAAYQDLSPYILAAKSSASVPPNTWTRPRSKLSSILLKLGFGYPPLVGLPLAAAFDLERIRRAISKLLSQYYPDAIFAARAWRRRRNSRDAFLARQTRMKIRIYDGSKPVVLSGPFAGMEYIDEVVWGPIEPKWLGTYERELHPIVERILQTNYSNIISVGSAEGYYAVGLAKRLPMARVYSYDVDPWARSQQRRLARLNGAKNIEIGKHCAGKELTDHIAGRALLVCDIEGGEYDLLNPNKTPALRRCDILVELHDHRDSGFSTPELGADELMRRFSASHEITKVGVAPRNSSALDTILQVNLTTQELADSMDERRSPEQIWVWLEARR